MKFTELNDVAKQKVLLRYKNRFHDFIATCDYDMFDESMKYFDFDEDGNTLKDDSL